MKEHSRLGGKPPPRRHCTGLYLLKSKEHWVCLSKDYFTFLASLTLEISQCISITFPVKDVYHRKFPSFYSTRRRKYSTISICLGVSCTMDLIHVKFKSPFQCPSQRDGHLECPQGQTYQYHVGKPISSVESSYLVFCMAPLLTKLCSKSLSISLVYQPEVTHHSPWEGFD